MAESATESSPHCRRRLRRLGMAALAFAMLAGAGVCYQAIDTWQDHRAFPPPGTLVDMGGYRLHLLEDGAGIPAVVLDAGLGCGALDWGLVQPEVARTTRVCSYDRAGLGWSEVGPAGHPLGENVETLHALLAKAGVPPPYVLVGHSMGGLDMQLFAARYPWEVSGMVLVDSSHGRQDVEPGMPHIPGFAPCLLRMLGPLGVVRMLGQAGRLSPLLGHCDNRLSKERTALYVGTRHLNAFAAELASLPASLAQARGTPWDFGSKPLIILSHGKDLQIPLLSRAKAEEMEGAWTRLQKDLASRSQNNCRIVAAQSGHFIPLEQPDLVVKAIARVVGSVRRHRPIESPKFMVE